MRRYRQKTFDCSEMAVMPKRCKTCPFNPDGCAEVREMVIGRTLEGVNQSCHSTRQKNGRYTHLCRGARDFQLQMFTALGVLPEPTDEAWDNKRKESGGKSE